MSGGVVGTAANSGWCKECCIARQAAWMKSDFPTILLGISQFLVCIRGVELVCYLAAISPPTPDATFLKASYLTGLWLTIVLNTIINHSVSFFRQLWYPETFLRMWKKLIMGWSRYYSRLEGLWDYWHALWTKGRALSAVETKTEWNNWLKFT